ncbi:MAG: U32 family peptidase [Oscillospiraceae bacterium]|nr:U32 family peptidase [Oscillospiraceae bacterium]
MNNTHKPEVLAPAGSLESIFAAVRCGADGIYAGGKLFSARANAVNFSHEDLKAAADQCHLHGVKLYRAMNTVIFDGEAEEFVREVKFCAEIGIDGLIIQDIGAAFLAERAVPNMPRHGSTQMTVHTPLGAIAAKNAGFCRIVPARELSLEAIRKICETGTETEVFVHGAQCMCLSGQCYMSALIGSRSANRGQCAQACRLPFSADNKKTEHYALSLKDMSLVSHIGELIDAGCASFKIEGRMKRPEYVAAAVTAVRHAADGEGDISEDMARLEAVFSRSGFTDGYLTGKIGGEMFGHRRKEDVVSADKVLPSLAALYKDEKKCRSICFSFAARAGKPVTLGFSSGDINGVISGAVPEAAVNRSLSAEDVKRQLSKLGGTVFELDGIICDIDEGITVPASELNRLRREAVSECERLTVMKNTPRYAVTGYSPEMPVPAGFSGNPALRVISSDAQTVRMAAEYSELVIAPINVCRGLSEDAVINKAAVSLPDIVTDEEGLLNELQALKARGFSHFVCGNFTHLGVLSELDNIHIHGGTGLNITNSFAIKRFKELGLEDITASFELKAAQFSSLCKEIPTGFYAYGRLPLMITRNCPVKAQSGCKSCSGGLTDRTGRFFPVECDDRKYARIRNCDILETSDKLSSFRGAAFALLDTGNMPLSQAEGVIRRYLGHGAPYGKFTRGLYFRGIK